MILNNLIKVGSIHGIYNKGSVDSYKINPNKYYTMDTDDQIMELVLTTVYQSDKITNMNKLKDKLLKEGALGTPSRIYEFIPRVVIMKKEELVKNTDDILNFLKYSYSKEIEDDKIICYTNERNIRKNLIKTNIIYDVDLSGNLYEHFFITKIYVPMFIRDQFMTHTQLSKINRSYRVSNQDNIDYWVPDNIDENIIKNNSDRIVEYVKSINNKKEIYSRFDNQVRYGQMTIAGWLNDPNGWYNFFLERGCINNLWDNWVQEETKTYAKIIFEHSKCVNYMIDEIKDGDLVEDIKTGLVGKIYKIDLINNKLKGFLCDPNDPYTCILTGLEDCKKVK